MFATIALSLVLFSSVAPEPYVAPDLAPAVERSAATPASIADATELRLALRDLWANHVFWVRAYVLAVHHGDAAASASAEAEAVKNARALADGIVPFYGQDAADALFGLLAGHYGAIKDYAESAYAEDAQAQEAAAQALSTNAEAIADFLDGANPHLPREAVLPLLLAHGGHHMQQIRAFHTGDFAAEAEVWYAMLGHVYTIADAMAGALAEQFPDVVAG